MTTALYRRYRPETFADVIGQEHVTGPLMQALRTGRINHAYLFSGPRGCGKTTSARILARCLNCEQGPTPEPCGVCDSCVALARGGAGSVDVIEIDAASHGGVDDARDLRERASYGPAQSRFKIYIIDEAHMVTPQGFNALLKIVEEPPEHVKFVFATTEPEKVIGTIRSRTHHYPFRLVPPLQLTDYMARLCEQEGVAVAPGVLGFVTRAGGGSVRDSLSVLDQLIAGSGDEGLTYDGAASLLGFTDGELLDATIDAFAAADGAAVFVQIDRVIESGHDPRRFVEDLLERLRDLIIVAAVPDGVGAVLRGVPEDQLERMRGQQSRFGPGSLSRAADIVNTGLTEMTGATAPRLQLELICARILLPAASGESGYAARLDRLERRLELGGTPSEGSGSGGSVPSRRPAAPAASPVVSSRAESLSAPSGGPSSPQEAQGAQEARGASQGRPQEAPQEAPHDALREGALREGARHDEDRPASPAPESERAHESDPHSRDAVTPTASASPRETSLHVEAETSASSAPVPGASAPAAGIDVAAIRRVWPDVLARIFQMRRATWTFVSQHAQVQEYDGSRLVLGIATIGLANTFRQGNHAELVRQALIDEIGLDVVVEGVPASDVPPPEDFPPPPDDQPGPRGAASDAGPGPGSGAGADSSPGGSSGSPGASAGSGASTGRSRPFDPAPDGAARPRPSGSGLADSGLSPAAEASADRADWGRSAAPAPAPDWATGAAGGVAGVSPPAPEPGRGPKPDVGCEPAPDRDLDPEPEPARASETPAMNTEPAATRQPAAPAPALALGVTEQSAAPVGTEQPAAPTGQSAAPVGTGQPAAPSTTGQPAAPVGTGQPAAPPATRQPAPPPTTRQPAPPRTPTIPEVTAAPGALTSDEASAQAASVREKIAMARLAAAERRDGGNRPDESPSPVSPDDTGVSDDDEDFVSSGAVGREVIERVLGGRHLGDFDD